MAYQGLVAPTTPTVKGGYQGISAPTVSPTPKPSANQPAELGLVAAPVVSAVKGAEAGYQGIPATPKNGTFVGSGFSDAVNTTIDAFSNAIKQGGQNLSTQVDVMQKQLGKTGTLGLEGDVALGKTIVGSIGTVFSAALSPLQGLATVPGIGNAVDFVNKLMGAVGEGSGQGAVQILNETPLPQATKDTLSPLIHDAASLAGQIASGKVSEVALGAFKDKITSITDTLHSHIQGAKAAVQTGPVKEITPIGESTTQSVTFSNDYSNPEKTIQMGVRPKDTLPVAATSPVEGSVVPETDTRASTPTETSAGSIPKELQPLAEEARKYKSAEEFVKAQTERPQYGYGHSPNSDGVPAFDLTAKVDGEQMIPKDMYTQWYGSRGTPSDLESIAALKKIKGNPEAEITIYRAAPKNEWNYGDWTTLSKKYAESHAEGNTGFKVFSKAVKAKDLKWAMDDVNEFGYFPESTKSQLTDLYNKAHGDAAQAITPKEASVNVVSLGEETPKEVKIQKTGTATKTASNINDTLVKQGFDALPPELQSKYTPESYKEELIKSRDLIGSNYIDAVARATGTKPVGNYEGQILFNEVEREATKQGDYQTLTDLAKSPLGKKLSSAGQTLGAHGFNDNPNSVVDALRSVSESRAAALEKSGNSIKKETPQIEKVFKEESVKARSPRQKWADFTKQIVCNI